MGGKWKQWETLFSWAPKSLHTVTSTMKLKKKKKFAPWRVMPNLDSILKSRDITLPTKVYIVRAVVFPAVMYRCESWTLKKAECQRTDAFELWCWRRLLRVPWTAKIKPVHPKGNQPWVFIGRTDVEADTSILWPPDAKKWCIGKDPDAGKHWGQEEKGSDRGWNGWIASLTQWTWVWANSRRQWRTGKPGVLQFMSSQSRTQLSDWLTATTTSS